MIKKNLSLSSINEQYANYYNNIASAWFIAAIINPFFIASEFNMITIVRAIIGLIISYLFLKISLDVVRQ